MSLVLRREIEAARPPRSPVDFNRPVAAWTELEPDGKGGTAKVAAVILTATECSWRCTMCDLWKHTATTPTPVGAIPRQIEQALSQLPQDARWIKLYNSGSFFDKRSIPPRDFSAIASLCKPFDRIIVENHPKLSNDNILSFSMLLEGQLEIALGVETLQTGMLRRLNKGMNRDDIDQAVLTHRRLAVDTRAFLLVRPPYTLDDEASRWTILTIRHLTRLGVRHASLIPVRAGNGYMERLTGEGSFAPPSISAIEKTFDLALELEPKPVVTLDLWDWPSSLSSDARYQGACTKCVSQRRARLEQMNLTQKKLPSIQCHCCIASSPCREERVVE